MVNVNGKWQIDIITLISFSLSVINTLIHICENCKKIEINLKSYYKQSTPKGIVYIMNLQIINKSKTAISIKGIGCNSSEVPYFSQKIRTENGEVVDRTAEFPINLIGLEGKLVYIELPVQKEIDIKNLFFNIYTNRGTLESQKINTENVKIEKPIRSIFD